MAQKQQGRRRANGIALTANTKSLTSFEITNTAPETFRQVPIGAIRLAQRFGLSVSAAAAVAAANNWGAP